jgi:hypothetical protein
MKADISRLTGDMSRVLAILERWQPPSA